MYVSHMLKMLQLQAKNNLNQIMAFNLKIKNSEKNKNVSITSAYMNGNDDTTTF